MRIAVMMVNMLAGDLGKPFFLMAPVLHFMDIEL